MISPAGAQPAHRLAADGVRLAYDDRIVVDGLSLAVPPGRFTVIVGPNACGKSTLLRALARLLKPKAGAVHLDGESIFRLPTREVATRLGIPRPPNQQDPAGFAFDLSLERVEEGDAFAIFVYVDRDADAELAILEANPLWERLGAVQAGRFFFVEASVWNGLDPIAANLILDDIDRHVGSALDR